MSSWRFAPIINDLNLVCLLFLDSIALLILRVFCSDKNRMKITRGILKHAYIIPSVENCVFHRVKGAIFDRDGYNFPIIKESDFQKSFVEGKKNL